ncbi:MAG: monovalent cation/H(+) antiporter subunit G [Deltaproteobacteria bacterium]|nr:monovalent cation/H(+) antiporter subunit G [Deltaproteobacteria bacterium]
MTLLKVLSILFIAGGIFFFFTATVGLLRFPDFFSRLHATGKGDTLAVFLSLVGLALYEGITLNGVKIILIAIFMFIAQPTATHAISKAGLRYGLKPWMKGDERR